MAKRQSTTNNDSEWTNDRVEIPKNAHRTTSELPPTRKIVENGQVAGVFQKAALTKIHDTTSKAVKEIMAYTFIDPKDGKKFSVLGGRTGMDAAFEDQFLEHGGMEKCVGMMCAIERGEDIERSNGQMGAIGTYNVYFWTPEK